jgi:hypothetical protein
MYIKINRINIYKVYLKIQKLIFIFKNKMNSYNYHSESQKKNHKMIDEGRIESKKEESDGEEDIVDMDYLLRKED